jgi:hypothetical protein
MASGLACVAATIAEMANERVQAAAWTHARPTVAGFYWLRVAGEFEAEVVRVESIDGALHAYICGAAHPVPVEGDRHEWCGPLMPPPG